MSSYTTYGAGEWTGAVPVKAAGLTSLALFTQKQQHPPSPHPQPVASHLHKDTTASKKALKELLKSRYAKLRAYAVYLGQVYYI